MESLPSEAVTPHSETTILHSHLETCVKDLYAAHALLVRAASPNVKYLSGLASEFLLKS